ncbi:ribose/galactose ABC transporter permease [Spiroplasma clarkii]|uniref:ABC transporter permease n=1 Tax=Spiroplasma clarkii TaxID=2139 RepID=UPI000B569FA0|nr:ABC transporter permease [Spiroplasma clarkii]ARU92280.1 ribose/galactose ABC transporter permease [Spiroplasma clarkii]
MKFNTKTWIVKRKTALYLKSPGFTNKFHYIKSSIIAILIGLVLGCITVYITGGNGIAYITTMFVEAFSTFGSKTGNQVSRTMNYTTVFIFMGLGLALGFKVGLFNMGGSGQAVLGFAACYLILRDIATNKGVAVTSLDSSIMLMVFVVFLICGIGVSVLTGILKVYFNIHEVATSIMLNWTIWYIMKWLISENNANLLQQNWLAISDNTWIIGLVMALISVAITWFVLSYTTVGYKFNMVGKQKTAAKYAGVNGNLFIIMTTAFQGLFISLGGIFYYFNVQKQQTFYTDMVPTIGFDAISVALVAFNNVIGIIPVALLWGIINSGAQAAADEAMSSQEMSYVITGVIMYCATIYILFMQFRPILMMKIQNYINKDVELRLLIGQNNEKLKRIEL